MTFRLNTRRYLALFASIFAALLGICCASAELVAAPPATSADLASIFDMDGSQIIQDELNIGIINGKLTLGIQFRDVGGIAGLWSPPYVSSNFMLDARVDGAKVPTADWKWRPFQVSREGKNGDVTVASKTTLIYGQRAVVASFSFTNSGDSSVPLEFFTLGSLDYVKVWTFQQGKSKTETALEVKDRVLTMRQGKMAVVAGLDSAEWKWDAEGNLGRAFSSLQAKKSAKVNLIIAIGPADEASSTVASILANPAKAIASSETEYARRVAELLEKLPKFESDNPRLVQWYNRSLVHLLMNRWDLPDFALQPYYSTGSVNGGCIASYLWNFGEPWEIFPLFDPAAARTHIKQFLKTDLTKHYLFTPISGEASGPWYMINQEKIVGLVYYYVLLTGDTKFLEDKVDGKTIRDHMVIHAMFGDDASKPIGLIDYGDSISHLELRRKYAYNHVSPDLNLRRYATYLRAATLCDLAGEPDPVLRERAKLLKPLVKERLWDPKARWFRFEDAKGKGDLRYTIQMFKPIGSGVLDKECEDGLLSHLNEDEFLSAYGIHSLSKRDPAFDQIDIDNGGGGACTCFPPQIIERLYQANKPELAADLLGRLLWWAEVMPYWGDSNTANMKDCRTDTPLQCTIDGSTVAQCIIFGVFGVSVEPSGDIVFKPNELPFAKKMSLRGLKIRGRSFDISVDGSKVNVRSDDQSVQTEIGKRVVFSAKDGRFISN